MVCSGMAVKRMGLLGASVRKVEALILKMETVIVIDEGIWKVTCCVCYVCEIDIKFFFSRHLIFGRTS
jgi:hypothetical protein